MKHFGNLKFETIKDYDRFKIEMRKIESELENSRTDETASYVLSFKKLENSRTDETASYVLSFKKYWLSVMRKKFSIAMMIKWRSFPFYANMVLFWKVLHVSPFNIGNAYTPA